MISNKLKNKLPIQSFLKLLWFHIKVIVCVFTSSKGIWWSSILTQELKNETSMETKLLQCRADNPQNSKSWDFRVAFFWEGEEEGM